MERKRWKTRLASLRWRTSKWQETMKTCNLSLYATLMLYQANLAVDGHVLKAGKVGAGVMAEFLQKTKTPYQDPPNAYQMVSLVTSVVF